MGVTNFACSKLGLILRKQFIRPVGAFPLCPVWSKADSSSPFKFVFLGGALVSFVCFSLKGMDCSCLLEFHVFNGFLPSLYHRNGCQSNASISFISKCRKLTTRKAWAPPVLQDGVTGGRQCLYIWLHCVKLMVAVSLCLGVNICKLFIRTAKCCLPGRWRIQEVPPSPSPAPTDPCVDLEGACLSQRVDCRSWHCGAGIDLNQSAFNSRQETVGWIIELSFVLHM